MRDAPPALRQTLWSRRYGGDLAGLVDRLDHIADLGATAVYLNPVFEAASLHKYDARDHRHVDPSFGPPGATAEGEGVDASTWSWTRADRYLLDVVLPEMRERDLRLILDGVWNHVGLDHWAFVDVRERGVDSAYAGWFEARFSEEGGGSGAPAGALIAWRAWDGANGSLPEFRQTPEGDLVAPVKAHVLDVTRRWMDPDADGDPSDGVDGWRLDVVPDVGLAFWRDWSDVVRRLRPDGVTIAEVWHTAPTYLEDGPFDAQMNYPVRQALLPWLAGDDRHDADALVGLLSRAFDLPDRINLAQMNLLGSHDTERVATALRREGVRAGERPGRAAYERVLLGVGVLVFLPGSPAIYAGDEWGVFGSNDPHNRKPVPWPDLQGYDDATAPLPWVHDGVRSWLRLRHDPRIGPVLRFGSWRFVDAGHPDVLVIDRQLNETVVRLVASRADVRVPIEALGEGWRSPDGAPAPRVLAPRSACVLLR